MKLQPVLMCIPDEPLTPPQQVARQHSFARTALEACAIRNDAPLDGWEQDAGGAPRPQAGWYWSLSHKRRWAAAVIADRPVGIDVEHIVPRREALWDAVAFDAERALLGQRTWTTFFRIWTAKEAVLKAHGVGIGRLTDCRLVQVPDDRGMVVMYLGHEWLVEHFLVGDHLAAVTSHGEPVTWHLMEATRATCPVPS